MTLQIVGELIGLVIEIFVGKVFFIADDGNFLWRPFNLLLKKLMNTQIL